MSGYILVLPNFVPNSCSIIWATVISIYCPSGVGLNVFTIQGNLQRLFNVQGCGLENLNKIKIQMDICLETQSCSPGVFLLNKFYLKSNLTNYNGILHDAL